MERKSKENVNCNESPGMIMGIALPLHTKGLCGGKEKAKELRGPRLKHWDSSRPTWPSKRNRNQLSNAAHVPLMVPKVFTKGWYPWKDFWWIWRSNFSNYLYNEGWRRSTFYFTQRKLIGRYIYDFVRPSILLWCSDNGTSIWNLTVLLLIMLFTWKILIWSFECSIPWLKGTT